MYFYWGINLLIIDLFIFDKLNFLMMFNGVLIISIKNFREWKKDWVLCLSLYFISVKMCLKNKGFIFLLFFLILRIILLYILLKELIIIGKFDKFSSYWMS